MNIPLKLKLLCLLILVFPGIYLSGQIAVYGDTRSNPEVHLQVVKAMANHHPKLAFHTGDLNSKGLKQEEYDLFHQITAPLTEQCPLYPVKGNHERSQELFLANFPILNGKSYSSILSDDIRFYLLDSTMDINPGSPQYKWLESALADTLPGVVFLHHPVFSSGEHGDELGLQLFLPQLLQRSNVRAVFSGHDHNYEHSSYNGIHYIVTGGGGAPLRPPKNSNPHSLKFVMAHHYLIVTRQDDSLLAEAWGLDGVLIDKVTIPLHP